MREPTRPLLPPLPLPDGGWRIASVATPVAFTVRGLALIPPDDVIPVIVVPGIMGTNLRAKTRPRLGRVDDERNSVVPPGQRAWCPPNGPLDGLKASLDWATLSPRERQNLLDPHTLEPDDGGPVVLPPDSREHLPGPDEARRRGWGEVHADSYGQLLHALEIRLNQTFSADRHGGLALNPEWQEVMAYRPPGPDGPGLEPLTEEHLRKSARYHFPVYAAGYNWLQDCEASSRRLEARIGEVIREWRDARRRCDKVILVTHSMGGLVARACARRIPDRIAGIIHGVMPALGAPVAYRRMACGTETSALTDGILESFGASRIAAILGAGPEETTPVLAVSPGALEMLPNHLYPGPWLHARVLQAYGPALEPGREIEGAAVRFRDQVCDFLSLPSGKVANPYDMYRDLSSWYRLVDPGLVDPAARYADRPGGVELVVRSAIDTAEAFHRSLGDYYHPNTCAFHGDDWNKRSFGQVRWIARMPVGSGEALSPARVASASYLGHTNRGGRLVQVNGRVELGFELEQQDARGDGTVPHQSGAGPAGGARYSFATLGHGHQDAYSHPDLIKLTLRLVVQTVWEHA